MVSKRSIRLFGLAAASVSLSGFVACSASTGDAPTALGDAGAGATLDGSNVPVSNPQDGATVQNVNLLPSVTCPTGQPISCCYASQKYGGRPGADTSCGPNGDEDCCQADAIPGGTFNRGNDPNYPATLPNFNLGRFKVTNARFKTWMDEGGGLQSAAPVAGAGANPNVPNSGWQTAWNANLAKDPAALQAKVYRDPAAQGWGCTLDYYPDQPNWPVNCIDWYEAQAFCAWDGGWAITEAEWEYAVRGGSEQRRWAWGNTPPTTLQQQVSCIQGGGTWNVDLFCNNPSSPNPQNVGFASQGQGKWGTYDLQGNLVELLRDESPAPIQPYVMPCSNDCISTNVSDAGIAPTRSITRGISFFLPENLGPDQYNNIENARIITMRKTFNGEFYGFRCAYPQPWSASSDGGAASLPPADGGAD